MTLPVGNWQRCKRDPSGHWWVQDGEWTVHCEYCGLDGRIVPEEVPE